MPTPDETSILVSKSLPGMMSALEKAYMELTGEDLCFALWVFRRGNPDVHGQRAQYIANVDRETMKTMIREMLDRWERGEDRGPVHTEKPEH